VGTLELYGGVKRPLLESAAARELIYSLVRPRIMVLKNGMVSIGGWTFHGPHAGLVVTLAARMGVSVQMEELVLVCREYGVPDLDVEPMLLEIDSRLIDFGYRITQPWRGWIRMLAI
jgi:hypothetical protein